MTLFELAAVLTLDRTSFDKGLQSAEKDGKSAGSRIGSAAGTVAKGVGVAIGAAAAGFVKLGKSSLEAFSNFEQLKDGVKILFDEIGSSAVMENASKAFQTAGLSANKYMEQATTMAAALTRSLGDDTLAAASYADMAIRDMADNANAMGTDITSIQDAYQGFSKQNYTMLDNLKLGYGGTKTEMQKLLKDAEEYQRKNGIVTKYSIDNYADIVEAIHVVQKKMEITGTTEVEAQKTIQGSLNMTKAAWENLLTGIADENADVDKLVDDVINSAGKAFDNIAPRLESIVGGVTKAIQKLAPKLPGIIQKLMPYVTSGVNAILAGVATALPTLVEGLVAALPDIGNTLAAILPDILTGLSNMLPSLASGVSQLLITLMGSLAQAAPTMIPQLMNGIVDMIIQILSDLPGLAKAGLALIEGIITGLYSGVNNLAAKVSDWWTNTAWPAIADFFKGVFELAGTIAAGIGEWWNNTAKPFIEGIAKGLFTLAGTLAQDVMTWWSGTAKPFLEGIAKGLFTLAGTLAQDVVNWWSGTAKPFLEGIATGFFTLVGRLGQAIANWWNSIWQSDGEGKLTGDYIVSGKLAQDIKAWWDDKWNKAKSLINGVYTLTGKLAQAISEWWTGIWNSDGEGKLTGIYTVFGKLAENINAWWKRITSGINLSLTYTIFPKIGGTNPFEDPVGAAEELINTQETTGVNPLHNFANLMKTEYNAKGLGYVPYNGYLTELHKGEAVLTARQAEEYRAGRAGNSSYNPTGILNAFIDALNSVTVQIDGHTAGTLLAQTVSEAIAATL